MNERLRRWGALLCACALALPAPALRAQSPEDVLCEPSDVFFGYFNGVLTTREEAEVQLNWLARQHGARSPSGDAIRYEVLYNYTAGFEDFVETFAQRLGEQGEALGERFELFFETVSGGRKGGWWEAITRAFPALAGVMRSLVDLALAKAVQALTALAGAPPTAANLAEHRMRLESVALEGNKLLLFAHSQGNLFVNEAYQHARQQVGEGSVRVVHAAAASVQLEGPHAVADKDLVLNALRLAGAVPPATDVIPPFLERPPGLNGSTDWFGHGLVEVYLNPQLAPAARLRAAVDDALASMQAPPRLATPGFFSATLRWQGHGDADLHVLEPGGAHVFFAAMQGPSGRLDLDNTSTGGPEHYYATCDARRLALGRYLVAVANYRAVQGREATVQVASARGGVLGTRSVTLGPETGGFPPAIVFEVQVVRDPVTGRPTAKLAPPAPMAPP